MRVLVTGATGWIGSALVPDLLAAGHEVVGLARSDASAAALTAAGAAVVRGSLDDLDVLAEAAAGADGVAHLAFKHEEAFGGNYPAAAAADRAVVEAVGAALAGTQRPFVIASGLSGHPAGTTITEENVPPAAAGPAERMRAERAVLALAASGVRSASVRLAATVHGEGDNGFVSVLVEVARRTGVAGHVGSGTNRWPAAHVTDAARLFRLALEAAPAGAVLHGVAEPGVPTRRIAEVIGRHLDLPVRSVEPEHFGWFGGFAGMDVTASSERTRNLLGWEPAGPGLLEDLDEGHYFRAQQVPPP